MHAFDEELPHMPQAIAKDSTRTYRTYPQARTREVIIRPGSERTRLRPENVDYTGYNVDYESDSIVNTLVTSPEYLRAIERQRMRRLPFMDQLAALLAEPVPVSTPPTNVEALHAGYVGI